MFGITYNPLYLVVVAAAAEYTQLLNLNGAETQAAFPALGPGSSTSSRDRPSISIGKVPRYLFNEYVPTSSGTSYLPR